jgi:hypothetical protein
MVTGVSRGVMTRCWTRIMSRCSRLSFAGSRNGNATRWTMKMAATAPRATQGVDPLAPPFFTMASTSRPKVTVAPMVAAALKMLARKMAITPPRSARQAIRTRAGTGRRARAARNPRGPGASMMRFFRGGGPSVLPPGAGGETVSRKSLKREKKSRLASGTKPERQAGSEAA